MMSMEIGQLTAVGIGFIFARIFDGEGAAS